MASRVTATWGEVTTCPIPYHSFRVGPFTVEVEVRQGEAEEQALERAQRAADAHGRRAYLAARDFWWREWRVAEKLSRG